MRRRSLLASLMLFLLPAVVQAQTLPAVTVDTSYVLPAQIVSVSSGASLQNAINTATLDTVLVLQAGATYGQVTLPNKTGSGWIYILSNGQLPVQGNRVGPGQASQFAKISVANTWAIQTAAGAHHYRFIGVEVSVTGTLGQAVVNLEGGSNQPTDIIFDRCYVHGATSGNQRRGITMNGARLAVIDSYVADFKEVQADTQAIWASSGTGPLLVQNNYLSAAGENFMTGGGDPDAAYRPGPSDITFVGNYVFKPLSWKGSSYTVKNLFELKNARRVLVEGNIFENNWLAGQNGMSILITPRNQGGTCPTCGVQDVTFRRNVLVNGQQGINILGIDNEHMSTRTARLLFQDNKFGVCCVNGSDGRGFMLTAGPVDVVFNRNTWPTVGSQSWSENTPKSTGFVFTNNVIPDGAYGLMGTNTATPSTTLTGHYTSPIWTGNALVNASASAYTNYPGNTFPTSVLNPPTGVGADAAILAAATLCTVSGQCAGNVPVPPNPPVDTVAPSVNVTSPLAGATATVGDILDLAATATDAVGVVGPITWLANGVATATPYTATAVGAVTFIASTKDAAGNTGSAQVTINVVAPVPPTPSPVDCKMTVTITEQTPTGFTALIALAQAPANGGKPCVPLTVTIK